MQAVEVRYVTIWSIEMQKESCYMWVNINVDNFYYIYCFIVFYCLRKD